MDRDILPSIVAAIEQGRGQRGRSQAAAWTRHRARALTLLHTGLIQARAAGTMGVGLTQLGTLVREGCEAVLRGGHPSAEADAVCRRLWQGWCQRGDAAACARLQPLPP